jgi:integrase
MPKSIRTWVNPVYPDGDQGQKPRADRARWRIYDETARRVIEEKNRTHKRRIDADNHVEALRREIDDYNRNEERILQLQAGAELLGSYARNYVDRTKRAALQERSWINLDGRLRNHILPVLGDRPLSSVTTEDVQLLLDNLTLREEDPLAPSTVRYVYNLINRILAKAVIDKKIPWNPCDGIDTKNELPRQEPGPEMLFLTREEIDILANCIDPRYRALIYVAGYSGLRAGELWALTKSRLHLPAGGVCKIQVHSAQSEPHGRVVVKPYPKNYRRREVPIPQKVAHILREHLLASPSENGLVFTAPGGGSVSHNNFKDRFFNPAVDKAGVPEGADHRLPFHDLRHTAAAIWIAARCEPKQLRTLLGDTSRAIERYEHLFPGPRGGPDATHGREHARDTGSVSGIPRNRVTDPIVKAFEKGTGSPKMTLGSLTQHPKTESVPIQLCQICVS